MSFSITFTELVNVAIPQCGVVNFKALHLLLQGILEHIQIAELKKVLSGEEDFLQSSPAVFIPREGDAQPIINPMKRLSNIFDQVVDRIEKIESKLAEMQDIPTTSQLVEESYGDKRPAEELWNNIKIQKRIEGNEKATEKFTRTLQDLLNDLHVLKGSVDTVQKDVDTIKFIFEKVNPQKLELLGDDLKTQSRKLGALQREVVTLQNKVRAVPQPEEMVLWSGLHEAMFSPEQQKLEVEPSGVWQSMVSLPGSPLEQPEDAGYIHIPIHSATPVPTMVQLGTTGALREEELTRAVELADFQRPELAPAFVSQTQRLERAQASVSQTQRLERAQASVSQTQNLRQTAPFPFPVPVPGFVPGPDFMPVYGPRPGMATPSAWALPRGLARGNFWPIWGIGPYQPGQGPLQPMGPMPRVPFPAMGSDIPWTQPLPQGTQWYPNIEERGPEYEEQYPEGYQEEMPMDEAPQEETAVYGALEEEIPTEGAPQDGIPKGRVRERISKEKVPKYRTPKERVSYHKASKDVSPKDTGTKDEAPEVKVLKKVVYKDRPQKDKAPEPRRKGPSSAIKKLRSAIATAAAAAAAYAAHANSAAQLAKDAVKAIQDVPANQLAAKAALIASSGPLGAFADFLGAGFGHGATSNIPFDEGELEEFPEEFAAPFNPFTSKPVLSQAMISAMQATSPEEKKKAVQYSMSHIAQMPSRHNSLKEEFTNLSATLNQRLNYLANMGSSGVLGSTVNVLEEKIINLQKARLQEEELERVWGHQIDTMKSHYMVLDRAVERLQIRMDDLKILKAEIERLDLVKADKNVMDLELNEKANRDALASKANRVDLETAAMELNEMIHSMLLKITNYESDWKKALKHLRKDLNTKLVQSDLNSLKKDIEEVWKVVRKLLLEGLRFDPDSAAGFKKKLFERVKCISCDRPVEMMTGPQLITIRNTHGLSRIRPASANSYEYLQRQLIREQQQHLHFQNFGVHEEGQGFQKDWGDGPRNENTLKHKSHDLSTLYPYGDPELMNYDTAEVDILGIDGVLYKGRMSSQFGTRTGEKDIAAVKVSYYTIPNLTDRVRPGSLLAPGYPPLGPRTSITSATTLHSATNTTTARPPSLPPVPQLPPLIPVSRDTQEAPGSAKRLKSPRL
uniref:RIKEN cDNA 4930562C15 gene n=1 Tax=Mus spicilegus TaxID=10103 RepID=A0A8C6I6Z4_MUSSI